MLLRTRQPVILCQHCDYPMVQAEGKAIYGVDTFSRAISGRRGRNHRNRSTVAAIGSDDRAAASGREDCRCWRLQRVQRWRLPNRLRLQHYLRYENRNNH